MEAARARASRRVLQDVPPRACRARELQLATGAADEFAWRMRLLTLLLLALIAAASGAAICAGTDPCTGLRCDTDPCP